MLIFDIHSENVIPLCLFNPDMLNQKKNALP